MATYWYKYSLLTSRKRRRKLRSPVHSPSKGVVMNLADAIAVVVTRPRADRMADRGMATLYLTALSQKVTVVRGLPA